MTRIPHTMDIASPRTISCRPSLVQWRALTSPARQTGWTLNVARRISRPKQQAERPKLSTALRRLTIDDLAQVLVKASDSLMEDHNIDGCEPRSGRPCKVLLTEAGATEEARRARRRRPAFSLDSARQGTRPGTTSAALFK